MTTDPEDTDLSPVEIIRDPEVVAALLKPPRLALLNALREPDSATGLARRLEEPRQRLNHHLHELERLGLVVLVEQRPRRNFTERVLALEYEDAAARATSVSPEALRKIVGYLCGVAHRQKIFYLWRPHLNDPKDHLVLELAVASRSSHLVTYNLRDFRGAERFGIEVVRPEDFLDLLEN